MIGYLQENDKFPRLQLAKQVITWQQGIDTYSSSKKGKIRKLILSMAVPKYGVSHFATIKGHVPVRYLVHAKTL